MYIIIIIISVNTCTKEGCCLFVVVLFSLFCWGWGRCFQSELLKEQPHWLIFCQWRAGKMGLWCVCYCCLTCQPCSWRYWYRLLGTKWQHPWWCSAQLSNSFYQRRPEIKSKTALTLSLFPPPPPLHWIGPLMLLRFQFPLFSLTDVTADLLNGLKTDRLQVWIPVLLASLSLRMWGSVPCPWIRWKTRVQGVVFIVSMTKPYICNFDNINVNICIMIVTIERHHLYHFRWSWPHFKFTETSDTCYN